MQTDLPVVADGAFASASFVTAPVPSGPAPEPVATTRRQPKAKPRTRPAPETEAAPAPEPAPEAKPFSPWRVTEAAAFRVGQLYERARAARAEAQAAAARAAEAERTFGEFVRALGLPDHAGVIVDPGDRFPVGTVIDPQTGAPLPSPA